MRHNIAKKVISAMLSGVLMLSLAGCGKAAKLPETVVNTSLVVEKDGKVVSYLVNTFDKDFYSLDGLTQMVQEEAEEFNAAHGDAAAPPMAVKTVQMLGDGATVQVVQEFTDTESYADYNEQELFYGTRVEALAEGISVDLGLVSAADGTPAEEQKLNKALDKMVQEVLSRVENSQERILAISHCNCPERAKMVKEKLEREAQFKEIIVLDTRGISTMYANDGGVIIAV